MAVENVWLIAALWIALALAASLLSVWLTISVALTEIVVGAMGFAAPYLGVLLFAHFVYAWPWPQAQIAGIALSTTSVAVVYAVMIETGFNKTEIGKIILGACFVNDLGTVLALGLVFANYNWWLLLFTFVTVAVLAILPRLVPWFFEKIGPRVSEPEIKLIFLFLLGVGGLAVVAKSEAVLPAYLIGMVLAPTFARYHVLAQRMRAIAFAGMTPFYFLKAGSLVDATTVLLSAGTIGAFLGMKMLTKIVGILPLTKAFRYDPREGMYTTLLMCTGLTFGSISALFGLTNHIIDQEQYTILVTAVILSAVVPTLIAER